MRKSCIWLALAIAATGLSGGSVAFAQSRNPYLAPSNRSVYNQAAYTSPTVSPYLNLSVNPNGLSTYQTLVKPMVEEREAIRVQADSLQLLRQQMRDSREPKGGSPATRSQPNGRFMHYSHFYGGGQ